MNIINLLPLISAHTGNDTYNHYMTSADLWVGRIVLIVSILVLALVIRFIRKRKK